MRDPSTMTVMGAYDSLMSTASGAVSPALVIAWSRDAAERVGEVALFADDGAWTLGRRGGTGRRVMFGRQRPSGMVDTGELRGRRISRDQLEIRREGHILHLRRLGHSTLRVEHDPIDVARVGPGDLVVIERALILYCELRPAVMSRVEPTSTEPSFDFGAADADGWVGESAAAWQLRQRIRWCGTAGKHVLVTGPSGAGKALVVLGLHRADPRGGPLVERNVATLSADLPAELFGRAPDTSGTLDRADGGTLVLDELGRISSAAQGQLLDVLDRGVYHRVGADAPRDVDVRVIGVSNRALAGLEPDFVARFWLRLDLPGLDERRADVILIARHLLGEMAREQPALFPDGAPRLHPRLAELLLRRRYTGHVRELARLLWAAVEGWSTGDRGKYLDVAPNGVRPAATSGAAAGPPTSTTIGARGEVQPPTEENPRALGPDVGLRLWPSLDGESCRAALVFEGVELTLPPRASHLVLLAAARERVGDAARGLPPSEQGWMYTETLADTLDVDRQRLNSEVYRARRQIEKLGVEGGDRLFERRPQTRQIRLGLARVTLHEATG